MRDLLTRRLGPFPVWLYFVVLVIGGVIFLRWRKTKGSGTSKLNSDATLAPNLTSQPSTLIPYTTDVFVNIQQPGAPGPAGEPGPAGPPGPAVETPVNNTPPPPPAQTSMTYLIKAGDTLRDIAYTFGYRDAGGNLIPEALYAANAATIEAVARQHGYSSSNGGWWIFPGTEILLPA